jgi:hypothetical protein
LLDALEEIKAEDEALARWAEGTDMRGALGARPQPRQPDDTQLATLAGIQRSIELSSAMDELRVLEDAEPLPRLSEDRLAHLLGRIGFGSYTPSDTGHPSHAGHPSAVTVQANCGPSDEYGYCQARYHTAHCGSLSTAEMAEVTRDGLRSAAYQPMTGPGGVPFTDQHGQAVTLAGAVEASMGERIGREHVFEGHARRELVSIQRQVVLGDQDDPGGDMPMPDETRRTAAALASHLGLTSANPARGRELARAQRDRVIAAQHLRSGGRRHPDLGESPQERAARVSKPGTGPLVMTEPGVSGLLPTYRPAGS